MNLIDTGLVEDRANRVVRMLMARDGMTQAQLAGLLGISQQQAGQRLLGKARWRFAELVGLADHFGVSIDDFGPGSRFLPPETAAVRSRGHGLLPSTNDQLSWSGPVFSRAQVDLRPIAA